LEYVIKSSLALTVHSHRLISQALTLNSRRLISETIWAYKTHAASRLFSSLVSSVAVDILL